MLLAPGGKAQQVQEDLRRRHQRQGGNWMDGFWERRYLGRRDRIALNANFFFLLRDGTESEPIARAATLTWAAATIHREFRDGHHKWPAQFVHLFGVTRLPQAFQDTIRSNSRARHVAVFIRGNVFRLDVLDADDRPFPAPALAAALASVAGTSAAPPSRCVGHLTTLPRADWARCRDQMLRAPVTAASFDEIESALFVVALDDEAPADTTAACASLLHGDSKNRWFDKSLSLVVFANGAAGVSIEHSCLDGLPVSRFVELLADRSSGAEHWAVETSRMPPIRALRFDLDRGLEQRVLRAGRDFANFASDTTTTLVDFDVFGSSWIKQCRLSPDAFVQLALQLAHQRARGRLGSIYESVSTHHFRDGRTEAMRVVTTQSAALVSAMDETTTWTPGRTSLRAAVAEHVVRVRTCKRGEAPEQHLWQIDMLAQGIDPGVEPLALFRSPGWVVLRDDFLSTSSVPCPAAEVVGFGATGDNCIGVSYDAQPDRIRFHLHARRPAAVALRRFANALPVALTELKALAEHA